jgi:tRNA (cytidine/uridine-2'-O-)-methyltransferase
MPFHIILHQPEIPQNTGSIGRLCVSTGARLHLIHPLGFDTSDYYLRRAGLDYWEKLDPTHYEHWEDFLARAPAKRLWFLSTKGASRHTDIRYEDGDGLVLGCETKGLPPTILEAHGTSLVKIPMPGDFHRSLNQAQAAAIVLYEALRQTEGW